MTLVPVRIGDLRHRLMVEQPIDVADGAGGFTRGWALLAEVWGAILPRTGGEGVEADRFAGRVMHTIWLRHRPGIVPGMRLRAGPRTFDIASVIDVAERRRWLRVEVEESSL
jgi:SPP1 family predicted phage head-tail adaptor